MPTVQSTLRFECMQDRSDSTEDGYVTAVKRHDQFADQCGYPKFDDLTVQHIEGKVEGVPGIQEYLSEFSTFILQYKISDKHVKPGTQKQYLSGLYNATKRKFPKLDVFKPWNEEWHNDLCNALKVRGVVEAIKRGESIGERTEGIHRDLLIEIADALLKKKGY